MSQTYRVPGGVAVGVPSEGFVDLILKRLPNACPSCRLVISFYAELAPELPRAKRVAIQAGYRSAAGLTRALGRHGFPAPSKLAAWIRVLHWIQAWEDSKSPLVRQAWHQGIDPSVCHRTIRRVTRMSWSEIRELGLDHWLHRFGEVCGEHVRCELTTVLRCSGPTRRQKVSSDSFRSSQRST